MDKIKLISLVRDAKKDWEETSNAFAIIDASIAYGTYKALGGVKKVELPAFVEQLYDITVRLAWIKNKCNNVLNKQSMLKINIYLADLNVTIQYHDDNIVLGRVKIETQGKKFVATVGEDLTLLLSEVGLILANEAYKDDSIDTSFVKDIMYKYFINIGRN